ncbi:diacylglycerol kinase [Streptomyces sp. ODS28]|uniref:diacylglycerol kinase n=1 Tax=Streptomyces sp. ODS28 TaxID=3136688 RepID=UPI0031EE537A
MSAPDPTRTSGAPLLVVVDPVAREADGESVRIARDVLCAGAPGAKVCLPESAEEAARVLARRCGPRRPVVVGDDGALLRAVQLLHRERVLGEAALSLVPVGDSPGGVRLARSLGIPADAVSAARAALRGAERAVDLLVDDCGGVVLGSLRLATGPYGDGRGNGSEADSPWQRVYRSLAGTARARVPRQRIRVEADGELLADWDVPVEEVSVAPDGCGAGFAEIAVRGAQPPVRRALARRITVAGPEFRYRAGGGAEYGPVRGARTWTVAPAALRMIVPGNETLSRRGGE